ncbi:hypothetical protein R1flu_021748 [Riccia fluitans]|uniref:Protein kinase domain-containing protein n=1 Tax=Riccia fluitans TaxID=41844 RepID=A0ABD1ZQM0_9MARC
MYRTLSTFNLTGTIPTVIADLFELNDLSLDHNNFIETIPDLSGLTKLQSLLLQNNKLSGKIPEFLVSLPLTLLANNNPSLSFGENKCQQPPAPSHERNSDKKSSRTGAVIGGAAGGVVLMLLILLLVYWKFLRKPDPKIVQGVAHEGGEVAVEQLRSRELRSGQKVAVKVNKGNTKHGKEQFLNEVTLLSRVHHRHLVSFVGFCNEGNHEVLIYEYMAQGTLEDHLFEKKGTKNGLLDWKTRLDIVLNASKDPEFFRDHRVTEKNDIYSFGVVLLEVITGKAPTTISKYMCDSTAVSSVS